MTAVLELDGISAGYGPFRALFDVSLATHGEAVALLGRTAWARPRSRVATGLVRPAAGAVRVDGGDLTGAPRPPLRPGRVAHAPEGRSVFATSPSRRTSGSRSAVEGCAGVSAALDRAFDQSPPWPAAGPAGGHAVRRRAADAVDGLGPGGGAQAAGGRRAVARACPIVVDRSTPTSPAKWPRARPC